ncbi:PH domain-containing protein [Propionimicrobium lymphophilum]|uniref:PH domain-containing protein n=1 Tax=Propionimicrobium lymphophilum TaxID=33012 RepID=UPI000491DF44|nr:PH domain-containing protein [Propionimicrobium lymphophilum]
MSDKTDDLFAPPGENWIALDARYLTKRRIDVLTQWPLLLVPIVVVCFIFTPTWLAAAVLLAALIFLGYRVWRQKALYQAWGYAERDSDLYIKHGIFWRNLSIVPYGRMQAIEITAGPISRWLGLANVELVTAATVSGGTIPGVNKEEAQRLRERLLAKGELQAAGL